MGPFLPQSFHHLSGMQAVVLWKTTSNFLILFLTIYHIVRLLPSKTLASPAHISDIYDVCFPPPCRHGEPPDYRFYASYVVSTQIRLWELQPTTFGRRWGRSTTPRPRLSWGSSGTVQSRRYDLKFIWEIYWPWKWIIEVSSYCSVGVVARV